MKTKALKTQPLRRLAAGSFFSSVPILAFLTAVPAHAQEGLADEMANESSAQAREKQMDLQSYSYKNGNFKVLLTPSLNLQWNDNINATETNKQDDFIVLPTLGVVMTYPLTQQNVLQLSLTGGYSDYLMHPHLSSWYLEAGSGLSFNLAIKDILLNLHDQFSYVQSASQNAQVAGTGSYGTFNNSAGLSGEWDLKHFTFTLGYDHQNTIATSSEFEDIDNSTESAYTKIGYNWNSKLTTGVEGSLAYTAYDRNVLNNNNSYSGGVYADWHPDKAFNIEPRIGYTVDEFQNNSADLHTADLGTWYVDIDINHQITKDISYAIDAGHNTSMGAQSDANVYWYANGSVTWNLTKAFSLSPRLFYQHGNQGEGSTLIALGPGLPSFLLQQDEVYNWYGGELGFSYDITKRFTMSWDYSLTQRTSSIQGRGYTQNIIGIEITYHPI